MAGYQALNQACKLANQDGFIQSDKRYFLNIFQTFLAKFMQLVGSSFHQPKCIAKYFDQVNLVHTTLSGYQGAFHVKPTPKVRQALSFCTPCIFREREIAKTSQNLPILRNSSTGPNS